MAQITIGGELFNIEEIYGENLTVPDCVVDDPNKLGTAKGEKKFYFRSKSLMRSFFGEQGFVVKCFVLKSDLIDYLNKVHSEYINPSQPYRSATELANLWQTRMDELQKLDEVIEFDMFDQIQIEGKRGYINTELRKDKKIIARGEKKGYRLITEIALPLISYVKILKLSTPSGSPIYYWKLFPDFDAIENKQEAFVYKYGKSDLPSPDIEIPNITPQEKEKQDQISQARKGQGKYREQLLSECWFCPFTRISEPELLIASHIKPWRDSNDEEKIDPKNGFALSPLYDKLFDRGFITFTDDRKVHLSNWISRNTYKLIGIEDNQFIQDLPIDEKRKIYLEYHREHVFNK